MNQEARLVPPPPQAAAYRSIKDLAESHRLGQQAILATTKECLEAIATRDQATHAVSARFDHEALAAASDLDRRLADRTLDARHMPLLGVPVLIKENIAVSGAPLRCGSRILKGYTCPFDATVITKLRSAGAIPVGYTNMDEFAMGSSCEHSCHGPTLNPYDLTRVPGGSSGGGAAASALGLASVGLGSDTGGSVRQPASYCNVFGFKPSYGAISRFGLVAFGSSLDQIGPFARSMDDLVQVFAVVAGADVRDATSADIAAEINAEITAGDQRISLASERSRGSAASLAGLRIAVPRNLIQAVCESDVWSAFCEFESGLRRAGCVISDVSMPGLDTALPTYYVLSSAEASSNLARFDGLKFGRRVEAQQREEAVREARSQGFGDEVKRRILLGTFALSSGYFDAYYGKALMARRLLRSAYDSLFAGHDVFLSPTTPSVAFPLGAQRQDPARMYANDVLTIPPSLAGLPALSVPVAGASAPVGMQLVCRWGADWSVLRIGQQLEHLGLCGIAGIGG